MILSCRFSAYAIGRLSTALLRLNVKNNFQSLQCGRNIKNIFYYNLRKFQSVNQLDNNVIRVHDSKHPYIARMKTKRELHKGGNRSCLHIEFDIKDSNISYEAGDHLVLFPVNSLNTIKYLGETCQGNLDESISDDEKINFPKGITYKTALMYYLDITALLTNDILNQLKQYCSNETDKAKIRELISGSNKYSYDIVDLLEQIPSCRISLSQICKILPSLKPRYYSISSSPKLHPNSVHITAVVANFKGSDGKNHKGITTGWLENLNPENENTAVPIYIVKSKFRLPKETQTPIIMICQGTGLAPFRSFIQEKQYQRINNKPLGDVVLYFGCRNKEHDFLYREELEAYEKSGLIKLYTAFSRDQRNKIYVTHLLHENSKELWDTINIKNGQIFVCGNVHSMAPDVRNVILEVIKREGNYGIADAEKYLKIMETENRYSTDAWS